MRNYCGLLVSPKLYAEHGYVVENKLVFTSNNSGNSESAERLWFMCGYGDTTLIVVKKNSANENALVESGMLLDLTSMPPVLHPASFFDYALHRLSSRSERVRLCNELRSLFAKRSKYRWCGGELESIFNRDIVENACEINGLAVLGRAFDHDGVLYGDLPEVVTSNYSYDVLSHLNSLEDEGQRKLAAVFHSIAIAHSVILYIGSSPGTGWIGALSYYPNISAVISVDPRPLDFYHDERITHHTEYITSVEQIFKLVENHINCVLIWDVRGDTRDDVERDSMILREISTLNLILNHSDLEKHFIALHLKINTRHFCHYELPKMGRFFIQPYTLTRDVFEVRYVAHLRGPGTSDLFSPSEEMRESVLAEMEKIRSDLVEGKIGETHLVANLLCARMRRVNYIETKSYNHAKEEICLFTITHNSPSEELRYLSDLRGRNIPYLISFFSGQALGDDPYCFPEGSVLSRNLGTILDSRSFIKAKLDGLYFPISDHLLTLMNEEIYTSETYKIRRTEYAVANRSRTTAYDISRITACEEKRLRFPKFPIGFSISEKLVSPSGHALRMTLEYLDGNASIALMAQKIINNFRNYKRSFVRPEIGSLVSDPRTSTFAGVLRHMGGGKISLERSPSSIWHSKLEWILGMEAAVRLKNPSQHQSEQIRLVCEYLDRAIVCPQPGSEIMSFYNRAFGNPSPLALPRASTRLVDPDRDVISVAND